MPTFTAEGGQFRLDGQPQFIQAGEFHYFRTQQDQWRHRLGLLKAAGFNAVAAYMPWLWHQLEENVSDFDGRSHPMRDLAGFLDLASEMGLFIIARPGPYIMAETINEGIPPWVFRKYPQTAYINQAGETQNVVSYLHPDFLSQVKKWYRAIFRVLTPRQVTHGGKIIMIQLDNEMGMIQWVRNIMDTNPDTLARFAAYLTTTYGEDLAGGYPARGEHLVEFLRSGILKPEESHAARIVEDYRRFYRAYLREYAAFLDAEARLNGMAVPPVLNIHGFGNGGKTFPIGLSQLVGAMEIEGMVSATDVYPIFIGEGNFHQLLLVNEMTKALQNKDQALFSIEFQAGGNPDFGNGQSSLPDLHTRLCISSGMRAINHYLFCDGENDPVLSPIKRHDWGHPVRKDGSLRNHYHRYPKLSQALKAYGPALIQAQPEPVTTIGFLLDTYLTEVSNVFAKPAADILTHQRDVVLFDFIARGLALTHRAFRAVELSRGDLDPADTPVCWVMLEKQCDAAIQQKLVDYARQGGRLILVGRMCAEDFQHRPCTILRDALGPTDIQDDAPFTQGFIDAFGYTDIPVSFMETYAGEFDEVFAVRQDGGTVGFIKTIGKGQVMLLGAAMTANTLDDLDIVHQMALKMGCLAPFQLSHWADVRLSRAEQGCFLYVNNYLDDPVETTITYQGQPLLDGNPVYLSARSGIILPIDWQVCNGVTLHYATAEIIEVSYDAPTLTLKTAQPVFIAELTLTGYRCEQAEPSSSELQGRLKINGREGEIKLTDIRAGM